MLYAPQAKGEGTLPLPIGKHNKFAPMALGVSYCYLILISVDLTCQQDLAQVVAHVLTGKGKHGFSDAHRGQLMVLTGTDRGPIVQKLNIY